MLVKETLNTVITRLKEDPANNYCFDCSRNDPQYVSITHGIFLCQNCAANHKVFGPEISEIRSLYYN